MFCCEMDQYQLVKVKEKKRGKKAVKIKRKKLGKAGKPFKLYKLVGSKKIKRSSNKKER